jgi:Tfp pilus assembly protein PilV
MNTSPTSTIRQLKRRKAMALILVIITVALLSILIIAIFSITRAVYKATQNFVAGRSQAQLQNAQSTSNQASGGDPATTTNQIIHATQPGMVRVYRANGEFLRAHKLYSSARMVVTSPNDEAQIFSQNHVIPQNWNADSNKARYVDLNEPVVRAGLALQRRCSFPSSIPVRPLPEPVPMDSNLWRWRAFPTRTRRHPSAALR